MLPYQRLRTNLTFGDAKIQVAQQASKQNTIEFLARAGVAIQRAVQYWNRYNWKWLMTQASDVTLEAGDGTMDVPYDFKDVYDIRVESNGRQHALVNTNRRLYDRLIHDQTARSEPGGYDLFSVDGRNVITLTPPPNTATTVRMRYYRRMWVPCSVTGIKTSWLWDSTRPYLTSDTTAYVDGWLRPFFLDDTVPGSATSKTDGYLTMSHVTIGSPVTSTTITNAENNKYWESASVFTGASDYPIYAGFNSGSGNAINNTIININKAYIQAGVGDAFQELSTYVPVTMSFGGDQLLLDMPVDFEDGILARATAHFLAGLGAPEGRLGYFMQKAEDELTEARRFNEENEDQDTSFEIGAPPPALGRFRSNGWV